METQKLSQEKMEYRVNSLQKDTISATIGEEKQSVSQMINELREEEQKLLNEGGWVRKETKRESVLKSIPLYFHLLMIMSTMIIIFLSILQSHRYLYILDFRLVCLKEDVFIAVWLFYISCLSIYIKFFISPYVENRDFYVKPICTNVQKPEILGTGNGIGFMFCGSYRRIWDTYVTYYCFCIYAPILPICCYRVTSGKTKYELGRGYSTGYKILCSEDSDFLAIIDLYLIGIAGFSFAACLLILLFYLIG